MATTINASTSAGLVSTADTSGVLQLQTAGTTALTVNTSGAIGVGTSPSYGTSGQVLTSAGSAAAPTWSTVSASPGGSTTQVQYNSSGAFAGSANMTFDGTSLTAGAFIPTSATAPANGMYLSGTNQLTIASNSTAKFTATTTESVLNGTGLPNSSGNPTVFSMSIGSSGWYASSSGANNYWNHSVNGTVYNLRYQGSTVGNITINSTNVAFVTTSDYRLKENVQPMTGALARVALLKPCTYTWKSNGEASEGFIAHELQEIVPLAVSGVKDALDEEGKIKPQGVDTSFLVATLTAAIQELSIKLDETNTANSAMAARIAALEAK